MKTLTTLLALVLSATFTLTAAGQDVAGSWQAESVGSIEPPKDAALTLTFGEENNATLTYTLAGQSQTWQYTYTVADGQLALRPAKPFGEPKTTTYDIKFDAGKLLLLTPKPKPVKEDADPAEEAGEDAEADASAEEEADKPETEDAQEVSKEEAAEPAEEEDTRVAVWVLTKA